jgi:hypothetical protein
MELNGLIMLHIRQNRPPPAYGFLAVVSKYESKTARQAGQILSRREIA